MNDRNVELKNILSHPESYEIMVRFTRSFGDDLNCGGEAILSDKPVGKALLEQFINELQQAYDETGMAGHFEVVSGPSAVLGRHRGTEYVPVEQSSRFEGESSIIY
jgi:hypothetical protein